MPPPRSASSQRPEAARGRARIRAAALADLPDLVRQRRQMFLAMGEADDERLAAADAAYARWFRREHRRGHLYAMVAHLPRHGIVAGGVVWLQERQPRPGFPGGRLPYLMSMFTDPVARGRGIATALVLHAVRWCRRQGYASLSLHASPQGKPIYRRLGFVRTNEFRLRIEPEAGRRPQRH